MGINAVTLTDLNQHNGTIILTDNFGNEYSGTLSNATVSVADPTEAKANIDATNPDQLDVIALSATGVTSINLVGDWTSQGNATSRANPDPTKPASLPIPDGTIEKGVTCKVSVTNSISRTFGLEVKFL